MLHKMPFWTGLAIGGALIWLFDSRKSKDRKPARNTSNEKPSSAKPADTTEVTATSTEN